MKQKRQASEAPLEEFQKASKVSKSSRKSHRFSSTHGQDLKALKAGDKGIWATCDRGQEGRANAELIDLLSECVSQLYGHYADATLHLAPREETSGQEVELDVATELQQLNTAQKSSLLHVVKLDVPCVLFVRTLDPIEPTNLVQFICEQTLSGRMSRRSRHLRRLTPVTLVRSATEQGVEELNRAVIEPVFHSEDCPTRQFAIRITRRNHTTLNKDTVISKIAQFVGPRHQVNLDHPDLIVLIEIHKNVCGMAVVGGNYDALRKYNLAELANSAKDRIGRGEHRVEKKMGSLMPISPAS